MEDKLIMSTILGNVKGACDLMLHGNVESATPDVHNTFSTGLQDCLTMQNEIYSKMAAKGWYPTQKAEEAKIAQAKQKFSGNK